MAATIIHVMKKNFKTGFSKGKIQLIKWWAGGPYLNVPITPHTVFKIGICCFEDQLCINQRGSYY